MSSEVRPHGMFDDAAPIIGERTRAKLNALAANVHDFMQIKSDLSELLSRPYPINPILPGGTKAYVHSGMVIARTITPAPTGGAAVNATYDAIICGGDPENPIIQDEEPLARDFGDTQFTPASVGSACVIIEYICGSEVEFVLWQVQEKLIYDNCAGGFTEDSTGGFVGNAPSSPNEFDFVLSRAAAAQGLAAFNQVA